MHTQHDLRLADGRTLRAHVVTPPHPRDDALTVVWQHGSPQTGAPLPPLVAAAAARGVRLVTYGRPGYGGSTPRPGRRVADAADDVAQLADALALGRFAVAGASGGGPHALACAARLGGRVTAALSIAGLAPRTADVDWLAGMASTAGWDAAARGREARARQAAAEPPPDGMFTDADRATLAGAWAALEGDTEAAVRAGLDGLADDDVALVGAWGVEPAEIRSPVLVVQGGSDRVVPPAHAHWLLGRCPDAELWLRPAEGHISILASLPLALEWLRHRGGAPP